ncbi:MAG: hypothetical protein KAS99_04195 [Candidatus Omnitrophica bacterium]|nr:hypothetical protein [Candidatus Omnitrophota bacterium]
MNKTLKIIFIFSLAVFVLVSIGAKTQFLPISLNAKEGDEWSIGIYKILSDNSSFQLTPYPGILNPVLSMKNVGCRNTKFVADPFLVFEKGTYYMFFETLTSKGGNIGLATSIEGINWEYQKVVLKEPFHLSYPCVFKYENQYYMIPESAEDKSIRLYKSENFPYKWKLVKKILTGNDFVDSTIFYYNDKWWLFTTISPSTLNLYYALTPDGPWTLHPKSPIIKNDRSKTRSGGNILNINGKLIRVAQNGYPRYGSSLRGFEILELTTNKYIEKEINKYPILKFSNTGWNKDGMHHLSALKINDREWLACVDGNKRNMHYYIRLEIPKVFYNFVYMFSKKISKFVELFKG